MIAYIINGVYNSEGVRNNDGDKRKSDDDGDNIDWWSMIMMMGFDHEYDYDDDWFWCFLFITGNPLPSSWWSPNKLPRPRARLLLKSANCSLTSLNANALATENVITSSDAMFSRTSSTRSRRELHKIYFAEQVQAFHNKVVSFARSRYLD